MELLSRANFSTNHKHRPGCSEQWAGRRYQAVCVKCKKWWGKSVPCSLPACWPLVSLPSLMLPLTARKSAMSSQLFKYKEIGVLVGGNFPQLIASPDCIAIIKTRWAIYRCSKPNEDGLRQTWRGHEVDSSRQPSICLWIWMTRSLLHAALLSPQHQEEGVRVPQGATHRRKFLHCIPCLLPKDTRTQLVQVLPSTVAKCFVAWASMEEAILKDDKAHSVAST